MAHCLLHLIVLNMLYSSGEVFDASGKAKFHIYGTWDEKIHRDVVGGESLVLPVVVMVHEICVIGNSKPFPLWQANPPIHKAEEQFGFTAFSLSLNQIDEGMQDRGLGL